MKRLLTRRSILGLLGAGTVAAIAPVALGWRQLFAEAAGTHSSIQRPSSNSATATPTFSGNVGRVVGPSQFIGSGKQFTGITVDLSGTPAAKIYPTGHLPYEGDTFYSRGHWLGSTGKSTWEIEFVDFNIYHVIGALSTSGVTARGSNYTVVDMATKRSWQVVIEAANLSHFTTHGTSPTPTDALLSFPDGTGAEMIGYEDRPARPGVLVVTFLEVHP